MKDSWLQKKVFWEQEAPPDRATARLSTGRTASGPECVDSSVLQGASGE